MSSEVHRLLTSTGYDPRSRIVRVLGKSAVISEVICVALRATKKVFEQPTLATDSILVRP